MMFIELIKSALLGLIQGISEWLPISSTGHMILFNELLPLQVSTEFMEMFLVVVQLASVLAVIIIYFNRLNPFAPSKTSEEKKRTWETWFKVIVGIIPVGIMGVLFKDFINSRFYNWQTVAFTLILYGVLFILIENWNKKRTTQVTSIQDMSYLKAFQIGLFQVLSLIPGTSRSGSTIMGSLLLRVDRPVAAEFSFFMSIPVMLGASVFSLDDFGWSFTSTELTILAVGCIVSFIVSFWAIKFLMSYIKTNDFKVFGWYRIILGIAVIVYFSWIRG